MHGTLADLAWLIDELGALRPLADVVPFDERPGPLPSITDLLKGLYLLHADAYDPHVRGVRMPVAEPQGLDATLDALIALRTDWIRYLADPALDWNRPLKVGEGHTLPLLDLCRRIVEQERALLRDIGDRLLTLAKPVP